METKVGQLGLTIPVATQKKSQLLELTPDAVMNWRNRLPMADTGATANQVYHLLNDSNQVILAPKDRFKILELLRTPVQFISQSLRKHYLQQTESLSEKKLTIVKLAQTLQMEMANGYKIILEDIVEKKGEDYKTLAVPVIDRILHYFTHVLLRSYHLYSQAPNQLWAEIYLLLQFAEKNNLLQGELSYNFNQILIMAASDPYKWRQSEQDALFNASAIWSKEAVIKSNVNNDKPGLYLFEIGKNSPPAPPGTTQATDAKNARIIDLTKIVTRLKTLLAEIEPDELRARIQHSNDPEYALPLPVLTGLIQEWETMPTRSEERIEKTGEVRTCISLSAIHYFASGEKPFQSQQDPQAMASSMSALPSLSIQEEGLATQAPIEITPSLPFESKKISAFQVYKTIETNESPWGYCLIWLGDAYPPIQAGELLGIERIQEGGKTEWMTAMVRWLKHPTPTELRLGVRILSKTTVAASAQIIKDEKPAGYFLRCLLLENGILTPTIPFKQGSNVIISKTDGSVQEVELLKLRSATGSYKLFDYKTKEGQKVEGKSTDATKETAAVDKMQKKPGRATDFDSIWTHL